MNRSLRIAVADDEPRMREFYKEMLTLLGHQVVAIAKSGTELVAQCQAQHPELVITDIKMPDLDGIEAAQEICKTEPVPIILVTAHDDPELLARADSNHILAYLVKPVKQKDLQPAILIAVRRFEEFQAMRKETSDLRQALRDRKIVERAKGIIQKRGGLTEAEAFSRLQKMARDNNRKLVQVAESILLAEEAYGAQEKT